MHTQGRPSRRRWTALIGASLWLAGEGLACADGDETSPANTESSLRKRAEELYREGAQLLSAEKYLEAEVRFRQSFELFKGRGTLLNLAICHENLGKIASAWREFKALDDEASLVGDRVRQDAAREHLAWIAPQLSYLQVALPADSDGTGVRVELDGVSVPALGVMFPVDPGRHQLQASAAGKQTWRQDFAIDNGNQRQSITVPPLLLITAPVPTTPLRASGGPDMGSPKASPRADYSGVYIAGTATAVLSVGAVVSAFLYYDRRSDYYAAATGRASASAEEVRSRRTSARDFGWINGSLLTGAAVGAGVTGVLWYRAWHASPRRPSEGIWAAPWLVGSAGGVQTGGSF